MSNKRFSEITVWVCISIAAWTMAVGSFWWFDNGATVGGLVGAALVSSIITTVVLVNLR